MTRRTVLIAALVLLAAAAAFAFRVSSNMVDFEVYRTAGRRAVAARCRLRRALLPAAGCARLLMDVLQEPA